MHIQIEKEGEFWAFNTILKLTEINIWNSLFFKGTHIKTDSFAIKTIIQQREKN